MKPLATLLLFVGCAGAPEPAAPAEDPGGDEPVADSGGPPVDAGHADSESAETCAGCHPTHYAEWRQSMHGYAALSPVFDAMAAKTYRDTSGEVGTFCTGCHTPIGTEDGEPGNTLAKDRSEISREGVTCDVCHRATGHKGTIGNTSLTYTAGATRYGPFASDATDGHPSASSELVVSTELCGSCHDVFAFPALRIEEAYTEYTTSPAAEAGVRCQDCHMTDTPGAVGDRPMEPVAIVDGKTYPDRPRSSHRFIGPDRSLLDEYPVADTPEQAAALRAEYDTQVQTLLENGAGIADLRVEQEGNQILIEVDVENRTTGHRVPTGFTSERQLWLEVVLRGPDGRVFGTSGDLDAHGDLRDEHAWTVLSGEAELDEQLVNYQSKNLLRHGEDPFIFTEPVIFPFDADWIQRESLLPGEIRTERFAFHAPPPGGTVDVRLRYRSMPPYVMRALQLDELIDRIETFDVDTRTADVP